MSENYFRYNPLDMSLTPGATLQNHKYVIQKVLHQSDFGVTYQAHHAFLEQPVVLQTLNESLRQRGDFAQLRQQFLNKVRSLAQQPIENVRVLDCFEEGETPFAVFELTAGQAALQLRDWFPLLPQTVNPIISISESDGSVTEISNSNSSVALEETQPPTPATVPPAAALTPTFADIAPTAITTQTSLESEPTVAVAALPVMSGTAPQSALSKSRSNAWMPITLISMCMLGSLLGASFGLSVRLAATAPSKAERLPKIPHGLFSREQNFPAAAEWPVAETPRFTSDPTPVEEPVYRVSPPPEDYSQPAFQPLPEAQVQQPDLPLPTEQPAVKATVPVKPELPLDATPSPVAPDITTTAPPEIPKLAPLAPVEPAAPPPIAPPELPAPAAELPIPEAAPSIPALPVQEPSVIKQ
jgi:hypothetical protein